MNQEQRQAYEWAKNQDYQSVAARYAKILAGLVDEIATPNEPLTCGLVDRHGMPLRAGDTVAAVREYGCSKYHDPDNWRRVEPQRYWEATLRHALAAWDNYEATDAESGLPHLAHMACDIAFILQIMKENKT